MAARLLAAISGLMLVRLLPINEYGFYTLLLAAFTFICTFSDLGATETLSFFRWRARKKNMPWMHYFHAVLRFRRTVFAFGFISSAVYVSLMGSHISEGALAIMAGLVLIGLSAWVSIHSGIISYVLKLEQRFRQAYAVELSNELAKLLTVGLIWGLGFATALASMASISIGALVAVALAINLLGKAGVMPAQPSPQQIRRRNRSLLGQVVPTLPGAIHFAVQGLFATWLAAYYGSVVNVAEVGALGRLGVLISVIAGFTGTVFVPRLIAITDESLFLHRYLLWWVVITAFGGSILLTVWVFPGVLLALLGDTYSGLHEELVVVSATAIVATWGSFAYAINRARGWVRLQPYSVPFIVAGQSVLFVLLDFSSTLGVLVFALGSFLIGFMYQLMINVFGFSSELQK